MKLTLDSLNEIKDESQIVENKSRLYLYPSLYDYGKKFITSISEWKIVGVGLKDFEKPEMFPDNSIGLLCYANGKFKSGKIGRSDFDNFPKQINNYFFGELLYGKTHMVVVPLPEKHYTAWKYFQESKYSLMYDDPKTLFSHSKSKIMKDNREKLIGVCSKSEEYRNKLATTLNISLDILSEDLELDSQIDPFLEIYNYKNN